MNFVGNCFSQKVENYFNPTQPEVQAETGKTSTSWSEPKSNPYFNQHSKPNTNTGSNTNTGWSTGSTSGNSDKNDGPSGASSNGQQQQDIVGNLLGMMNREKPKDTAGWIELGIQSFAQYNRNNKK